MTLLRAFLLLPVIVIAAACGSSTSPATSSSAPAASSNSQPASAAPTGDSSQAGAITLTTDELPSGSETWTQIDDGTLSGGSVHKRAWQNADKTQAIEIDLLVESSSSQAANDWSSWDTTVKSKVTNATNPQCPSSAPSNCTESVGQSSSGKSEVVIDWQQGSALVALFLVNGAGTADKSYAEQVASAQGQKIPQ